MLIDSSSNFEPENTDNHPADQSVAIDSLSTTHIDASRIQASTSYKPPLSYLSFPPEIRVRIYEFVLDASDKSPKQRYRTPSFAAELSLLLVSRQTYFESYHIYYRINTIHLSTTTNLFRFLCKIGYARRQQLVSISFQNFDENAKRAFLILRTARRLKRIRFILPTILPPGYAALREVRGMESVEIRCDRDCSELIEAMKRPRLARFRSPKDPDDLFKQRREVFPKLERERLGIDMNWTHGICLCRHCKLLLETRPPYLW